MAIRQKPTHLPVGKITKAVPAWGEQSQESPAESPLRRVRERDKAATPELAEIRKQAQEWQERKSRKRR